MTKHESSNSASPENITGESAAPPGPIKPRVFTSPVQFLAFGFGSGLMPKGPGTAGTLMAVPLFLLASDWGLPLYTAVLLLSFALGIWICGVASSQLGVHDHGGIVWDEFVGYWITMWAVPVSWTWIIVGFVIFRIFDILKPWPISVLDKKVGGGFGIMIDDVVAGIMACVTLHLALWLVA